MQVEIYDATELTADLQPEDVAEARRLVEEMGLDGQRELHSGDSALAWEPLTPIEQRVYSVLLPTREKLERFAESYVPARVLREAQKAAPHFDLLQVWSSGVAREDPLLVGRKGTEYSGTIYKVARWGDVLLPLSDLIEQARVRWRAKREGELRSSLIAIQRGLETIDSDAQIHFAGGSVDAIYATVNT